MSAIATLAGGIGAKLVEQALARRIGAGNANLARQMAEAVAERAGVPLGEIETAAARDPERVTAAIREVEAEVAPHLVALYARELETKAAMFEAERGEPLWVRAWRPLGMYGLGILWFWNLIVLHVANAVWKIALPPTDLGVLMQLSALYMTLYMGGHTVKDVAKQWKPGR